MSRRNAGAQPDSYQLRWHSVANPGTASVDIMSSPDPLNDPTTPDVPSSNTRRITRSQRAHKFLSLGVSPRKQAYELDVGSSRSSRGGLVVSVETDEEEAPDDTRRTLFPTPGPGTARRRTRERTTTTVVPLKYPIEDESSDVLGSTNATPRLPRKTRIRKSNGTPIPKTNTRKRRAPTPPRPADESESDARSPTPKRRARTPRKPVEPSSDLGIEAPAASVRRSVRRRRQAMAPNEFVELAAPMSEDDLSRDMTADQGMPTPASDADQDIWTTLDDDATPRASTQRQASIPLDEGDYGYLAAGSDVSSVDEPPAARNDTIAQGEDFSMIVMDEIPSFNASMHSTAPATYSDLGDDTNLIINNTLESLRQGEVADREDEGDDDADTLNNEASEEEAEVDADADANGEEEDEREEDAQPDVEVGDLEEQFEAEDQAFAEIGNVEKEAQVQAAPSPIASRRSFAVPLRISPEPESEAAVSEADQFEEDKVPQAEMQHQLYDEVPEEPEEPEEEEPEEEEPEEPEEEPELQAETELEPPAQAVQQPPTSWSFRPSQSPRKPTSPLRHRVLKQSALGVDSPDRTPRAANTQTQEPADESSYNDSFSEIPDAVLQAATPRRPGRAFSFELDDAEVEEVMGEIEASQQAMEPEMEVEETEDVLEMEDMQDAVEADAEVMEGAYDAEDAEEAAEEAHEVEEAEEAAEAEDMLDEADQVEAPSEQGSLDADLGVYDEPEIDAGFVQADYAENNNIPSNASVHSEASRLPTPDNTPPQINVPEIPQPTSRQSRSRSIFSSPAQPSQAQPSPTPRSHPSIVVQQAENAAQSGSSLEETPKNQISSPAQPQSLGQEAASHHLRPALSSIVRVGRVLQSVTSDPPSPEAGDRHLGSPFRSSGSKDSRGGSREREGSRLLSRSPSARIPSKSPTARVLDFGKPSTSPRSAFRERTKSIEPQQAQPSAQQSRERTKSIEPAVQERPSASPRQPTFRERTRSIEPPVQRPLPSPAQRQSREQSRERFGIESTQLAAQRQSPATQSPRQSLARSTRNAEPFEAVQNERPALGRISANSSLQHDPGSDGEMSWIANEGPMSPNLRGDNTLRDVAAASTRPAGRSSFLARSPIRPLFTRQPQPEPALESEEEPDPEPAAEPEPEPEPELEQDEPDQAEPEPVPRDDETDIWELEAERETPKPRQQPFGTSTRRAQTPRRTGIPSPWMRRSIQASQAPKAVPLQLAVEEPGSPFRQEEDTEEYSLLARRRAAEEAQKLSESAAKASKFDLSSFFSSPAAIPGMLADKFFPGKSKPEAAAAPLVPAGNLFPQVPQMEFVPSSAGRRSLFSSPTSQRTDKQTDTVSQQPSQQPSQASVQRSASPETPEQLSVPKRSDQTFTPRARQTSHTFAQPSSTAPTAASAATPPRMQLSHADIRRWQQDANMSSNSSNASEDSFVRPLLRPLPPKHASPTKSSLRSPLKPRTPGRVVEFTSSVLSPLEQAQARHQRQISQSMLSQSMSFMDDNANEPAYQEHSHDKENQESSDVSMADAPPLAGQQGLSGTAWTRQHWLLMDQIIQARRQGPFDVRYERRSDKYLGKTVKSQGAAMELERWHLDCVDAFIAEVGGWDEGVLAKRLFALLLGEERRSQAPQQRTVMFH